MLRRLVWIAATVGVGFGAWLARRRSARRVASGHRSESAEEYERARHRILILGGGFGGMAAAVALDRRLQPGEASVLVVDRDTSLLFTPLLWTVADGRTDPNDVVVPVRAFQRGRRFHVLHAEVDRIDLDRQEVTTSAGPRPYDTLIIALGSVTAIPDLPGLREHARLFHTPADALRLRNHVIDALEVAHRTLDPVERRAWLTFVVGGGGDTGIELAATIHDYLAAGLLADYPWLTDTPPRIVVVGRADRLVPMSDERTSAAVRRELDANGIEIRTGVAIEAVTDRAVVTSAGEIPAHTLFWAAGIAPPPIVRELPVEHARNGAVIVDDRLCVPAYPEVAVVGDAAWAFDAVTRAPVPPTAQAAQYEGRYVAGAIAARLAGSEAPPFRFSPKGHLALLGHRTGVAQVGPFVLTGWPAWILWHAYYLYQIPAWRNRLHLATDLALATLTGRATAQLPLDSRR